eukprot:7994830-Pyramimonas_sp.AAC.1
MPARLAIHISSLAIFWMTFLRWGVYNPLSMVAPLRSMEISRQLSAVDVVMLPATRWRKHDPTSPVDQLQTYKHRIF